MDACFVDHDRRLQLIEDLRSLGRREQHVDRSDRRSELEAGDGRHHELRPVGDRDRDRVAGPDAFRAQPPRERPRLREQVGIAAAAAVRDDGRPRARALRGGVQQSEERRWLGCRQRLQGRKSASLIRCQTSAGTRWRGV
jgi:hypothetical protein